MLLLDRKSTAKISW